MEIDAMQEALKQIMQRIEENSISNQFPAVASALADSVLASEQAIAQINFNDICCVLASMQDTIMDIAKIDYSAIYDSIGSLSNTLLQFVQSEIQEVCLPSDLLDDLHRIEPYLPEEQQEEFHEIVHTEPNQNEKSLPVEVLRFLLEYFLFPLLVAIISTTVANQLPDSTEEQIIENQNAQIALSEEQNELLQEFVDLTERLVIALEERGDVLDDDTDLLLDSEQSESQDENSNAQNQTNDF